MPGYTLDDNLTLKNKLGTTSHDELEHRQAPLVAARDIEIAIGAGPGGRFDAEHLKALHGHLFQDVFEWAGRSRDEPVRLADGATAIEPTLRKVEGQPFAIGPMISRRLDAVLQPLADQNLFADLERGEFADRAGELFAEINSIHAFREGNGRTQRAFFTELAKASGHQLEFDVVSRERMVAVSVTAHERGDVTGIQRMFREISDPDRVAALRHAQGFLDRHRDKLDWRDYYMSTTEPGQTYGLTFVGSAGANFMGRTNEAIVIGRVADLPDPPPEAGQRFTMTASEVEADAMRPQSTGQRMR